jgi:sulfoquinovosidase
VQRPLFLHHEQDRNTYDIQDSYLYGAELLVAPVWQAGETERRLYLPEGAIWVHAWSTAEYDGGQEVTVTAPLGQPPVFYRSDAEFKSLFAGLRAL